MSCHHDKVLLIFEHQHLSHAAIVGYSTVSHDNHMQATWRESDWHIDTIVNRIQRMIQFNTRN